MGERRASGPLTRHCVSIASTSQSVATMPLIHSWPRLFPVDAYKAHLIYLGILIREEDAVFNGSLRPRPKGPLGSPLVSANEQYPSNRRDGAGTRS